MSRTFTGRAVALTLVFGLALPLGGCATSVRKADGMPDRSTARNVLIGVAAATVAIAVGGALAGNATEASLKDDLAAGKVSGDDYVSRDRTGKRWNRLSKFALFGTGLSLVGMALLWEASEGDRIQYGPIEGPSQGSKPPVASASPGAAPAALVSSPSVALEPVSSSVPLPALLAPPSAVAQSWATAK